MNEAGKIFDKAQELTVNAQYKKAIALLQEALSNFEILKDWRNYVQACNELGKNFNHLSKTTQALHYLQSSLQTVAKNLAPNHLHLAHAHNNIGYTYSLLGESDQVLQHYQQAFHIFQQHYVDNFHSDLGMIHSNLGWIYGEKGNIPQAIIHHQQAIHIYLHTLGNTHEQTAVAYNNTGYVYGLKNDYTNALLYYQQAFNIWEQTLGKNHPQLIHAYNNIGWCHRMNEKYMEALQFYEKALNLSQTALGENHATTAQIHNNMGSCYSLQNEYHKSIQKHQQALQIQQNIYANEHPTIAQTLMNMGIVKGKQKQFDPALSYLQQSLKQYQHFVAEKHPRIAMVCNEIANIYRRSKQFDAAISSFHQVLQKVLPNYQTDDVEAIPNLEGFENENALLYALNGKAASLWEKSLEIQDSNLNTQIPENTIKASFWHFEAAVNLIQHIRQSYKADESKLSLSKSILPVYEGAIKAAFWHFEVTHSKIYLQKAFDFSEQGKSMVLLGNLKNNNALTASNIPTGLQEKIQELEIELKYLDKKIIQEQLKASTPQSSKLLQKLQQQHFDFHEEYQTLIETLETDYADYFQLKYAIENIQIELVQEKIGASSVFIEYFVGENSIFIFVITPQKYGGITLQKPSDFVEMLDNFHRAIEWMDEELFIEAANKLYDFLLKPIEDYWIEKEELLIIRDDVLHLLAFDALLLPLSTEVSVEEDSFSNLPYLIHDYAIAYHYSAHLWQHTQNNWHGRKQSKDGRFLGIAPVVFQQKSDVNTLKAVAWKTHQGKTQRLRNVSGDGNELQNLPSTALEVKRVYELFQHKKMDAKAFLYAAASKQVFFEEMPHHEYILIATHGLVHDEHQNLSGIYLANSDVGEPSKEEKNSPYYVLTIPEIYHLNLRQTKLVVLSSCSSGVGKLYKGEGMMALNRGFLYAGASNIIFTQFDIPDESSSELVQHLFEYILDGDSYAKALQKAKCKRILLQDSNPQDWAGFAYIGILEGKQAID